MTYQAIELLEDRALFAVAPVAVGNFATAGLDPRVITPLGNKVIFTAETFQAGRELWVSDGTAPGTMMLRDIGEGTRDGVIGDIHAVGSLVYFSAIDNDGGLGYWRTDGTQAGTLLLNYVQRFGSEILHTSLGSTEYFNDGYSLWKTNGTEAGTVQVKNFASTSGYGQQSEITNLVMAGNYVYATLYGKGDPTNFYNINPIYRTSGSTMDKLGAANVRRLYALGTDAYFMGSMNGITGAWKINTDKSIKNLSSEEASNFSTSDGNFATYGNSAYYMLPDINGELHLKQVTGNTATEVMPLGIFNSQAFMFAINGKVVILNSYDKQLVSVDVTGKTITTLFAATDDQALSGGNYDSNALEFYVGDRDDSLSNRYRTDGTLSGTKIYPKTEIEKLTNDPVVKVGAKIYYPGMDSTFRKELFAANLDGTSPVIVYDQKTSNSSVQINDTLLVGTSLYVKVREASDLDGSSTVLWKVSAQGDLKALDRLDNNSLYNDILMNTNGSRIFLQYGAYYTPQKIRVYDGTQFLDPGINASRLTYLSSIGNKAIYADFFYSDSSIIITDGTTAGTTHIGQYQDAESDPGLVTTINGIAYFVINQSDDKVLWQSDGTSAGTHAVDNLLNFNKSDFFITGVSNLNGKLILMGSDYTGNDENPYTDKIFVFDPKTTSSTLFTSGDATEQPRVLGVVGGNVIYSQGNDLYRTNGTAVGTAKIQTFTDYSISSDQAFVSGSNLYLTVQKEVYYNNNTTQIWRTDGTTAKTARIEGLDDANTSQAVAIGGVSYFKANNTATLYAYNGTKVTKALELPNVFEQPQFDDSESLYNLKVFNNKIYYSRRYTTQSDALYAFTPDTVTPPTPTHSISGKIFNDLNKNGKQDAGELGLSGFRVFIDANLNGGFNAGEKFMLTDANGNYYFDNLTKATYNIRVTVPTPWKPVSTKTAKLTFSGTLISQSFGVYK